MNYSEVASFVTLNRLLSVILTQRNPQVTADTADPNYSLSFLYYGCKSTICYMRKLRTMPLATWTVQSQIVKCWCCTKPNKRGRNSALLGPHQHALARMQVYDHHTVKTTVRTMWKSQIHSHNIRNSIWPKRVHFCWVWHNTTIVLLLQLIYLFARSTSHMANLVRLVTKAIRFQNEGKHWWATAPLYQKQGNQSGLNSWRYCLKKW